MIPSICLVNRAAQEEAVSKLLAGEPGGTLDPQELALFHDVSKIYTETIDQSLVIRFHIRCEEEDESKDPGISEVHVYFDPAEWAAFKAFVDAKMSEMSTPTAE